MKDLETKVHEYALRVSKANELKFLSIYIGAKKEFTIKYNESDTDIVLSFLTHLNKLGVSIEKVSFPENFKLPTI